MASVQVNQMLAAAAAACEEKQAADIRILALDPSESGLTDYFLVCSGNSDRQTVAITDEIELRLKRDFATYPNSVEGRQQGEWVLMDYVDFIVHVFLPEKRAYYGLERLRPSATTLSIEELNGEIKAAITAQRSRKPTPAASPKATEQILPPTKKPSLKPDTTPGVKGSSRKSVKKSAKSIKTTSKAAKVKRASPSRLK